MHSAVLTAGCQNSRLSSEQRATGGQSTHPDRHVGLGEVLVDGVYDKLLAISLAVLHLHVQTQDTSRAEWQMSEASHNS